MEYGVPNGVNTLRNEEGLMEGGAGAQASDNRRKQKPQVATLLVVKNKQAKVQVETILVPQRHVTEGGCGDGGTKIDLVGEGGRYGCVRAVDLEQQGTIDQQAMRLSALGCEEQHEIGSRGAGEGGRASLMEEVDEEDSRGENAVMRTPEHNEDEPSDMGAAVNDQGGKAHDCTRAFLDIEGHWWSGDEGAPHQCSRTEYQGEPLDVGVVADKARGAVGQATEHRG